MAALKSYAPCPIDCFNTMLKPVRLTLNLGVHDGRGVAQVLPVWGAHYEQSDGDNAVGRALPVSSPRGRAWLARPPKCAGGDRWAGAPKGPAKVRALCICRHEASWRVSIDDCGMARLHYSSRSAGTLIASRVSLPGAGGSSVVWW